MIEGENSSDIIVELQKTIASGCRMLAIREHSENQIRTKLLKKGFSKSAVNRCIDYLLEHDWLSESRFCNVFIRSKANKGQGLQRIVAELKLQQISQSTIKQELATEKIDWQSICDRTFLKKISIFSSNDRNGPKGNTQSIINVNIKEFKKLE